MLLKKPPMGWNTWNTFGRAINEELILQTADKMVELGYKDAGYEYLIIDDCWSEMKRDENGKLAPDREKFPHGMKYIADYIHAKGLKFGMYSDAGFKTCAGYPSSFGHEIEDARTFAEWEIDYLKYDFGYFPNNANAPATYLIMAQALRMTGRDIVFAVCTAGRREPGTWSRSHGGHTFRSTDDIRDTVASYRDILASQADALENNTFDCFNDMDMLTVGMEGKGNVAHEGGMTYQDYENHFLAWAFCGSPLIIGGDIRKMDEKYHKLLQSRDVIAINQDADCRPPFRIQDFYTQGYVLARMLSGGDFAILAVNFHGHPHTLSASFDDMGLRTGCGYGFAIKNALTGEDLGVHESGFAPRVGAGQVQLFRATPVALR